MIRQHPQFVPAYGAASSTGMEKVLYGTDGRRGSAAATPRAPALKGLTFRRPRRWRRDPGPDARQSTLSAAPRCFCTTGDRDDLGHDAFAVRGPGAVWSPRIGRGSFCKKIRRQKPQLRGALHGMTGRETKAKPRISFSLSASGRPLAGAEENLSREMQRTSHSPRALTAPVLLLLDEPTTGLDPRSKQEVQTFIREIRAEHDATILLCTHDLAEAELLADRVGILDRGELLCLEPVDELKRRFGAETLEEAFFAATGRSFEDEQEEADRKELAQ